jgi:hypothetical protein
MRLHWDRSADSGPIDYYIYTSYPTKRTFVSGAGRTAVDTTFAYPADVSMTSVRYSVESGLVYARLK